MGHEKRGFREIFLSFSRAGGLAPGGVTERKHLDLTITDTPSRELKMYRVTCSTSITCATATEHVQKTSPAAPAAAVTS